MEGNLEWWATGRGEIVDMNRFGGDKGKVFPEEEDQNEVEQNREKEKQRRKEKSQCEEKRRQKQCVHFLKSPLSKLVI